MDCIGRYRGENTATHYYSVITSLPPSLGHPTMSSLCLAQNFVCLGRMNEESMKLNNSSRTDRNNIFTLSSTWNNRNKLEKLFLLCVFAIYASGMKYLCIVVAA